MVKDGWHVCHGRYVYVENGYVLRAMKRDHNGGLVPAAVYRWSDRLRWWVNVYDTRALSTVRNGLANGTYKVM